MQEAKITDPSRPKKSEDLFGPIHWQWQSGPNPDPWAEKDASKWSWQDYSPHDSLIIEEAFSLQKETADLGNYEVDFAKMTQVNKQFRNRARRVRRREKSRFLMHIPKPIAVTKEQRRMSQAPGTIQYFLDRMMKTAPEAFGLYQRLKTLKLNSPYTEFEDIIKAVVSCIEKGAEVRERIVKARNSSEKTTFLIEAKKIKETIEGHSQLLGDFLWSVLRVYAMEIFVCYWINEALRSEDWEEIHVLAPFMVCLVYTFKHPEFLITYKEPKGLFKNLKGIVKKPKIRLYKGAALSKEEMERYDRSRIKFFSWSGITSVSRDENVALNFMKKAKKLNEQKVTVLFKIKAYFTSPEDHEGIIDLLQNGCSLFRDEQEVILGPGTVFKLRKTKWLEADILQVNLKLKKSFKEKKENNVPLLENVQEEKAISEDKAIIDGLPSQQSLNLLEKLKGNKMIRKLEIRNSGIDDSIMKEIESLRASTKTAKEDVRFVNNTIIIGDLGYFAGYLSIANANRILTSNKIRFKEGEISKDAASEIKTLVLSEESLQNFKQTNQLKELSAKITSAPKIESLDLKLPNSEFTDFLQCIGEAKGLKSLRLKINKENFMERRGFEILCQAIKQSNTLGQLSLDLSLSDGEFSFLKETLESLHPIPELSLDLRFCDKVSDEGLNHLKNGLISLSSLENLSLEFLKCNNISDKGLNNLRGCFSALTSLQNLSLNFAGCSNLSDEGLHYLKVGMVSIPSLPRLSLNFAECSKISDEGLNQLKRGLLSFSHLRLLSLNFKRCNKISDKGLNILKSGLTVLTSLQNLSLSFDECFNISYEGFGYIKESILKNLQNLSLSFENCSEIPIEALSDLKSVVIELKSLKNLSLSFAYCKNISDKGLNEIKSCLESLPSLQSLSLSFAGCNDISDEGLERLKDGLLGLKSLQHLSLNFAGCDRVSDEGLGHLKEGFKGLTKIELLSLSFDNCSKVSDMGISHLKSGIISLPALQNLSLNFKRCNKVSDQGLNHVKSAVISVPLLRHLCLNFKNCWQISDEGLGRLRDGFKKMAALQYLALNIQGCEKVSEKERTKFCDELKDIPSLSFE